MQLPLNLEDTECSPSKILIYALIEVGFFSPSVNRRIDVSKIPLICGNLTIGLHVPLPSKQVELLLCKRGIDDG